MTKRERIQLNMIKSSDAWLKKNETSLETIPKYTEAKAELELTIEAAGEAAEQADQGGGSAEKKEENRTRLIDAAMEALNPLVLKAAYIKDVQLLNQTEFVISTFNKMTVEGLSTRCNVLLDLVEANDATEYGQTPELITEFDEALKAYNAVASIPRLSIAERKVANARLSEFIDDAMDILNDKMDRSMKLIKKTNPKLYEEYEAVRIIIG